MPRGSSPNSRANLEKNKLKKGLPAKEQREIQKKGTKASVEKRKQYASMRECFRDCIDDETRKMLYEKLISMSHSGDLNAMKMLMDVLAENMAEEKSTDDKPVIVLPQREIIDEN